MFLDIKNLELIIRRVFSSVSYNFDFEIKKGEKPYKGESGLRLLALESIKTHFTDDILELKVEKQMSNSNSEVQTIQNSGLTGRMNAKNQSELDFINKVEEEKNLSQDDEDNIDQAHMGELRKKQNSSLFENIMKSDDVLKNFETKK